MKRFALLALLSLSACGDPAMENKDIASQVAFCQAHHLDPTPTYGVNGLTKIQCEPPDEKTVISGVPKGAICTLGHEDHFANQFVCDKYEVAP